MLMKYFCLRLKPVLGLKFLFYYLLLILLFLGANSCSTDLEVNAPYQETKVLYSILDPKLPFQTIRVSKGFLSDGRPADEIAKNSPDSSLYKPSDLRVEFLEWKNGSTLIRSWDCKDTMYTNKGDGVFYHPDQMVFKTPNLVLDTLSPSTVSYSFRVTNKLTGKVSEAFSNIPGSDFALISPISDRPVDPASVLFRSNTETLIRVRRSVNTEIAQLSIYWNIQVVRNIGGTQDTIVEKWWMNNPGISPVQGNEIRGLIGRGTFWSFIQSQLEERGNENVVSRKFLTSTLVVFGGNKEYDNYRTVNGNYNAITQSTPIYTNVKNGLGIVCGRNSKNFAIRVANQSIDTLLVRFPALKLVK
jgi:hypothetical protein